MDAPLAMDAAPLGWEQIDLYRFFAYVFGVPTTDRFAYLQLPELSEWLAELWQQLDCDGDFPGVDTYSDYEDYESTYVAVFEVGIPAPPVPLQESAHDDANPAPQLILDNTHFYEVLGLNVNPTRYAPDHLVTQLEFLAAVRFARASTADAENRESLIRLERDFLERHLLNWLPIAQEKLAREQPPIFPALFALLIAFVQQQYDELSGE